MAVLIRWPSIPPIAPRDQEPLRRFLHDLAQRGMKLGPPDGPMAALAAFDRVFYAVLMDQLAKTSDVRQALLTTMDRSIGELHQRVPAAERQHLVESVQGSMMTVTNFVAGAIEGFVAGRLSQGTATS